MSDGSFEKVEEDVVMVTEADYDLAEKVATQHKNEEDSASLELAGQTTEDFTFLAESSHLDVQKSLADLEEAIAKLSTKDTEETKVSEESSTLPGPAQGDRGEGSVSKDTFVAFDRTPDGSYKITNTATDWPLVPGHIRSKLRNFTIGELYVHLQGGHFPHGVHLPPNPGGLRPSGDEAPTYPHLGGRPCPKERCFGGAQVGPRSRNF